MEVKKSEQPGAEDGLFVIREVMAGEVIAFYSGLLIYCESSLRALDRRELSDEEECASTDGQSHNLQLLLKCLNPKIKSQISNLKSQIKTSISNFISSKI